MTFISSLVLEHPSIRLKIEDNPFEELSWNKQLLKGFKTSLKMVLLSPTSLERKLKKTSEVGVSQNFQTKLDVNFSGWRASPPHRGCAARAWRGQRSERWLEGGTLWTITETPSGQQPDSHATSACLVNLWMIVNPLVNPYEIPINPHKGSAIFNRKLLVYWRVNSKTISGKVAQKCTKDEAPPEMGRVVVCMFDI